MNISKGTLLCLFISGLIFSLYQAPLSAQTNLGCVNSGFSVDADAYSNYIQFGNGSLNDTDDWFSNDILNAGNGLAVIDTSNTSLFFSQLIAKRNIAFYRNQSNEKFSFVDGNLWMDAVYGRDYIGSNPEVDNTAFVNANKNGDHPFDWNTNATTLNINHDIVDVFGHLRRDGLSLSNDLWCFFGASTVGVADERYVDFELFAKDLNYDLQGGFISAGLEEGHTAWAFKSDGSVASTGDVIVSVGIASGQLTDFSIRIWVSKNDFENNSPSEFLFENEFDGASANPQFGYAEIKLPATDFACGLLNSSATTAAPWGTFNSSGSWSAAYNQSQFFELGFNLSELGLDLNLSPDSTICDLPFSKFISKSRTSISFTSPLIDFAGPYPFGGKQDVKVTILGDPISCNNLTPILNVANPSTNLTYSWTTANGNIISSSTGNQIRINEPGTYIVLANSSTCGIQASDTIEIFEFIENDTTVLNFTTCDPEWIGSTTLQHKNQYGCDSIVVTNYSYSTPAIVTLNESICEGDYYLFLGDTITEANTYQQEVDGGSCGILLTLNLSMIASDTTRIVTNTCNPLDTNTLINTYANISGCDSIVIEEIIYTTEICGNGIDDDCDGMVDAFDLDCNSCPTGMVVYERWNDVSGTTVSSLTSNSNYPDSPDASGVLSALQGARNIANNYGTRVRGFLHPQETGNYNFTVTGDDNTSFYLSTDDGSTNLNLLASVTGWTGITEFNKYASQNSGDIFLEAGKGYYLEVLHKEGSGGDHFQVYWQTPSNTTRTIISGNFLSPYMACQPEICGNGIDDDNDGLIDDLDLDCPNFQTNISCDAYYYYLPPVWRPTYELYNQPSGFEISTSFQTANVQVQTAQGIAFDQQYTLSTGNPIQIPLSIDLMQTANANTIEADRGFIITSDVPIQVLYAIDGYYNKVLLTAKGPESLGRAFRTGSQVYTIPHATSRNENHFISVMATEDNTKVNFEFPYDMYDISSPHETILNAGETYLIRDDNTNTTISGSLVTSDKPIVVVSGSQHSRQPNTVDKDGGIDMLVPVERVGDQYVLVRGKVPSDYDYGIVVGIENLTQVFVNGNTVPEGIVNAGEYFKYNLSGAVGTPFLITTSEPAYMYHVTGQFSEEVGMGLVSPTGPCRGSKRVEFSNLFTGDELAYVVIEDVGLPTLMINGFAYDHPSINAIPIPIPGLTGYSSVTFQESVLENSNFISSEGYFTAGLMVGHTGSGTYGYLNSFEEKVNILHPENFLPTNSYFVDTICGGNSMIHCVNPESCGSFNEIISIAPGPHTLRVTINSHLCFEYEPEPGYVGLDNIYVTVQNEFGIRGVVCLEFYICPDQGYTSEPCLVPITPKGPEDYVPRVQCDYLSNGVVSTAPVMFADVDKDKQTELVVLHHNSPNGFVIIDPTNCEVEQEVEVFGNVNPRDGGLALGDVDNDGFVDIFIAVENYIQRWEYDKRDQEVKHIWTTSQTCVTASKRHLDIIDLDNDGVAEIIPNGGQIVNSHTGYVYPGALPNIDPNGKGLYAYNAYATPGLAPVGEGNVEIICGTSLVRYDFLNEEWVLVRQLANYNWGLQSNASIADVDLDGDVDAVISNFATGEALVWDLQTNSILGGGLFDYPGDLGGRPVLANFDDDEYPEMAMVSEDKIFAIDDIVTSGSFGNILWIDDAFDQSGYSQLSAFDFDGNGKFEILFRDDSQFRIYAGLGDGVPNGIYPSSSLLLQSPSVGAIQCATNTGMEYPTIGDVDGDGAAEIMISCASGISVLESSTFTWMNSLEIWNMNAYNITNVDVNGGIPAFPRENFWSYNNFLCQPSLNSSQAPDSIYAADVDVVFLAAEYGCNGNAELMIEVCNMGNATFPSSSPVALYNGNPTTTGTYIDTVLLYTFVRPGECIQQLITKVEIGDSIENIFAVINDNGLLEPPFVFDHVEDGGSFPITYVLECDYTNKLGTGIELTPKLPSDTTISVVLCQGETFVNGRNTYQVSGNFVDTLIANNGCDSFVNISVLVIEPDTVFNYETYCKGDTVDFYGESISENGTYYNVFVSENDCDSIIVLELSFNIDTVYINRTTCHPDSSGVVVSTSSNVNSCDSTTITVTELLESDTTYFYIQTCDETATSRNELLTNTVGCDSLVITTIEILASDTIYLSLTSCDASATGSEELLTNTVGCDSLVITTIEILASDTTYVSLTSCDANATGSEELLTNTVGCDSLVITTIEVLASDTTYVSLTSCDASATGSEELLTNALGCDSLVITRIEVLESDTTYVSLTSCDASGTVSEELLTNALGCDSLVITTIEILPTERTYVYLTSCDSNAVGNTEVFTNIQGCDSTVITRIEIVSPDTTYLTLETCDYTQSDFTTFLTNQQGCDSLVFTSVNYLPVDTTVLEMTTCNSDLLPTTDVLSNRFGCDSVIITTIDLIDLDTTFLDIDTCDSTVENSISNLTNQYGCDSIVVVNVNYFSTDTTTVELTTCDLSTANYYQTLPNVSGCDSVIYFQYNHVDVVQNNFDFSICEGDSVLIGEEFYKNSYSNRETFVSENGCDSIVTIVVEVIPRASLFTEDFHICIGEKIELIAEGEFESIIWSPATDLSCTTCPNPTVAPHRDIVYTASTIDCNGDTLRATSSIFVSFPPDVEILVDSSIIIQDSIILIAHSNNPETQFSWRKSDGLPCEGCDQITVNSNEEGRYELYGRISEGCEDKDQIEFRKKDICERGDLIVSNAIMPNGDGYNDYLEMEATGEVEVRLIRVFNRWGEIVFESNSISNKWDGTFRGERLNTGVYVYYIQSYCPGKGEVIYTGNVTILY